jgi:uncharacterized protein YoxC
MAGELATDLANKKAQIDKLLDEFDWHSTRVDEISREAGRLIGSLAKEHGSEGLQVISELYQRLQRIAWKFEQSKRSSISYVV